MTKCKKNWLLLIEFLCFLMLGLAALGLQPTERPSLRQFSSQLLRGEEITKVYLGSTKGGSTAQQLLETNKDLLARFAKAVQSSEAFVRGEIEDEKTLNFVTNLLQLEILLMRSELAEQRPAKAGEVASRWFNFAADLSYEESSLVGLRLAGVIRSLLLDELERALQERPSEMATAGSWIKALRAPWPVDRVFLYESKRVLKPKSLQVAERVAKSFQKNPYQTAEQILKKTPGGGGEDLEFLKSIWRSSDLKAMQTEINRLGLLRARSADLQFESTKKTRALGWEDLRASGGLEAVPIDYFTGRPMDWAQLLAARTSATSKDKDAGAGKH